MQYYLNKEFSTLNSYILTVKIKRNQIQCFLKDDKEYLQKYRFYLLFDKQSFKKLSDYLMELSLSLWQDFEPKEATSMSSDYAEYYDREFDNEGCLGIYKARKPDNIALLVEKPSIESNLLYKFNKRRMESFLFDIKNERYIR